MVKSLCYYLFIIIIFETKFSVLAQLGFSLAWLELGWAVTIAQLGFSLAWLGWAVTIKTAGGSRVVLRGLQGFEVGG